MLLVIRRVLVPRVVPPEARALRLPASRLRLPLSVVVLAPSRDVLLSRVSALLVSREMLLLSRDVLLTSRSTVLPSRRTLLASLPTSLRLKIPLAFSVLGSAVVVSTTRGVVRLLILVLMAMSLRKQLLIADRLLGSRLDSELPMLGRAMNVVMPSPVVDLTMLRLVAIPEVLLLKTMFIVATSGAMTAWLALPIPMALALPPARLTRTARRLSPFTRPLRSLAMLLSAQAIPVETGRLWLAAFPQQMLALLAP